MDPHLFGPCLLFFAVILAVLCLILAGHGHFRTAVAGIVLAVVSAGVGTYLILTDDTPTWDERLESKYAIEIGAVHDDRLDEPGAWEIDGQWRTCYSPDIDVRLGADEVGTLLCQPVIPEAGFVEVDNLGQTD